MAMEIFTVGRGQEGYPERLMPFADMPSRLFVRGALPADEQKTAAIVGARICTAYGKSQAAFFAQVLAANGVAVISGLACGIDAAAHERALRGKGKTFAVLGCGVDICYPKQNYPLMRRMLENGGGVLSEFPPGAEPLPWHFPIRNRVISALADVVLVIEAKEKSGMDREATDSELSGGIICDGLGSSFAAALGVLPNTSFAQNVGIISMTKIVNRMALSCGAVFLILCGLCPKIAAFVSIMPQSVLGGAAVMMFASILVSGIQLITKEPITSREITIVSVALGLGYGLGSTAGAISELPYYIQLIFGGSGIVPAAVTAIVLNIIIPKEKKKAE